MDTLDENSNFKSFIRDELNELMIEDEVENAICVAKEHAFVRWKPKSVNEIMFVSKDVLLIRTDKTIMFYNVKTQEEYILLTDRSNSNLHLDGIGCIDCNGIDLVAIGEHSPNTMVVICRYPELRELKTLADKSNPASYISILFMKLEYLIGLRAYPAYDLIVWAWRIGEKLLVINTEFTQPNQNLSLTATSRNVYLSQMEHSVQSKLQLWTLAISCKTVFAEKIPVKLPNNMNVISGCWTSSGLFVFCDSSMNVYRTQPHKPEPKICFEKSEDNEIPKKGTKNALLSAYKQGFLLYMYGQLTCFKDTDGVFTKKWTLVVNHQLVHITIRENLNVYGWADVGTLLELTQKKENVLKYYGSKIKYFTFIKPTDETLATVDANNILQVWDVSNGALKNETKLNGIVTYMCSNPLYCYIAVLFKNGKMELIKTHPKANDLEHISKILLCKEDLSLLSFSSDGKQCVVVSFLTGLFYRISIYLGQKCSVIKDFNMEKQIIDIETFDSKTMSFLAVLYSNDHPELSKIVGNNIVIFNKNFQVIFKLQDTSYDYTSIHKWISVGAPNELSIAFTANQSKRIHLMFVNIETKVFESDFVSTEHSLGVIHLSMGKTHFVTFSSDGSYYLYEFDDDGHFENISHANCSHWQNGGLVAAQVDVNAINILTLSYRGNFMCTTFKRETCYNHIRGSDQANNSIFINNMQTEGIGYEDESLTPKRMTWTLINEQNKSNAIELQFSEHKNKLTEEFEKIKLELLKLFENNINGPEYTKINIEEFDLNVENRFEHKEICKIKRQEYEANIFEEITKLTNDTNDILKDNWESKTVKPKSIYCLKKCYKVDNYPLNMIDEDIETKANAIINKRSLTDEDNFSDSSTNTIEYLKITDDTMDFNLKQSSCKLIVGSISDRFVDYVEKLTCQYKYPKSLEIVEDEIILLQFMISKIKHRFNELFDQIFAEKISKLVNLEGYNDRLRVIESEFRLSCKVEPTGPSPVDYELNQYEQTEQLTRVTDDEVLPEKPFITPSKQLLIDASLVKGEIDSRLLAIYNFRQRALMDMMDGVLEKRWEDELKIDVPKPQCMLNKNPEDYVEEDFRAITEYEKQVFNLNNERKQYKQILDEEQIKLFQHINESIDEFDSSVFKLFNNKLKYDSAIQQECLKISRLAKMLKDSNKLKQQINQNELQSLKFEETIKNKTKNISQTTDVLHALKETTVQLKKASNLVMQNLASEFNSRLKYKRALNIFERVPKLQGNKNYSLILVYQFVDALMNPSDDKRKTLSSEFSKYLNTLKTYEDYNYVDEHKLNMDKKTWEKICKLRHQRIELEFKMTASLKDIIDKSKLIDSLVHDIKIKEAMIGELKMANNKLENKNSIYIADPEIQLIIKGDQAEIRLTGHIQDFERTSLVSRFSIEQVNAQIKEVGKMKIDALVEQLKFSREFKLLERKRDILKKHKVKLFKFRFDFISSLRISHNMLKYIKYYMKGIDIVESAKQKYAKEKAGLDKTYTREKNEMMRHLNEITGKIRDIKINLEVTDRKIEKVNIRLNELVNKIDHSLNSKLKSVREKRFIEIMERAEVVTQIKELHHDNNVLRVVLEILLLKMFPTLPF